MATLVFPNQHSPVEDAESIHKSFQGWGTDEKTIITILGHRNTYQRQQIRKAYEELFQEDLVKRLEKEIHGDFERAVYRWILEPADRDAVLAHVVIRDGKNYHVIAEIATVLSPEELLAMRRAYLLRYKHSLEEDVAAATSGHLRQLLVGLVTSYRYVGEEINARLAQSEAEIFHEAIKEKKGSQEEVIRILTTRSKAQLVATFNRYREAHGTSISKKLVDETSDDFQKALHTAIRCFNDHTKYYEKVVRNAIKKVGTDEDALTRVIVSRAEKDLREIKELYYKRNSVHLEQAVAKEISGDYKNFLLTLLGKED
ncbi:annexin-like protein RJ4 isoform X1 [Prosopis cineraria]|uniref:annexin-like protein RJ4 isoform X1 n=1 Tax=Prosopis cineraria TaxID=364024 RepID=UPI00240F6428|nr:annexin-like protein RJ4 isoform X1 [Prosopis cineraria]